MQSKSKINEVVETIREFLRVIATFTTINNSRDTERCMGHCTLIASQLCNFLLLHS